MYSKLFSKLILLPKHYEELKRKRGLSDQIINGAGLKSGGPHNEEIVNDLMQTESKGKLRALQIMQGDEASPLLLQDGVIIPYHTGNGLEYFRVHKFGLKDKTPPVYVPPRIEGLSDRWLIIAESEFKALAATVLGFRALGVPGITTHSKNNFDMLAVAIRDTKIKEVIILWDNECKNDPEYKDYFKPDKHARYDVEVWSYVLAMKINNLGDGINCRIATLPDDWRINGGIDLDAALAAGHGTDEFKAFIVDALGPKEYAAGWSEECQSVARRKVDRALYNSPISSEFGRYLVQTKNGVMPITNFTLRIGNSYRIRTKDDYVLNRSVIIADQYDNVSTPFFVESATISNVMAFRNWVASKGPYVMKGSQKELDLIIELETLNSDNSIIECPELLGWCEYLNCYLLGDVVVNGTGEAITPDENGVFWTKERGVRATSPYGEESVRLTSYKKDVNAAEVIKNIYENWNSQDMYLACGWTLACIFLDAIVKEHRVFPLLSISGVKESGKSSLAEMLASICGMNNIVMNSIDTMTPPGLERAMQFHSNLPIFMDEYRSSYKIQTQWDSILRSIYDRQRPTKAKRNSDEGVVTRRMRAGIVLIGETRPADSALATRCILVQMPKTFTGSTWKWIKENRRKFSAIYRQIAQQREKAIPVLLKRIEDMTKAFRKQDNDLSERYALNYAIATAPLELFAPGIFELDPQAFVTYITEHMQSNQAETNSSHISVSFIRELLTYKMRDSDFPKHGLAMRKTEGDGYEVVMHLPTAYSLWRTYQRSIGEYNPGWTEDSVKRALRVAGWGCKTVTMNGKTCYCITAPLHAIQDDQLREELKEMDAIA